jgi:Cofilin/tropomyosin-type actin-binding protein
MANLVFQGDCAAALEDVRSESATDWVIFTYAPKSPNEIRVLETGDDFWDFMETFSPGKIMYSFVRFNIKGFWRYILVTWCGEGVQGMTKGRFSAHAKVPPASALLSSSVFPSQDYRTLSLLLFGSISLSRTRV